jgi:hypothetical protein
MAASPLVKKFSYRDLSGRSLEEHAAHWAGFSWEAGPVIVQHKGAEWGTPQVWASSADEGKRMIRHAAAISGIDPDGPGCEWVISGTTNPRYGRRGTMQVRRLADGYLAVTKREGSSGLPEVVSVDP